MFMGCLVFGVQVQEAIVGRLKSVIGLHVAHKQ